MSSGPKVARLINSKFPFLSLWRGLPDHGGRIWLRAIRFSLLVFVPVSGLRLGCRCAPPSISRQRPGSRCWLQDPLC
ncbi:hypothetical protein CC2G_012976 [Coprinopsis cinerea AmutBmut pab1-1]|nr:hypothetical protein CC2G_012976 [Coprinopsis cinerea AmutBmut pab1-1]